MTSSGLADASGDSEDVDPGIGLDDATPFGDTDQHSDVIEVREARARQRESAMRGRNG